MKKFIMISAASLMLGVSAWASDLPEYVSTCSSLGIEKLRDEAQLYKYVLKEESFGYCAIDNRWYNPSKYVLYCAEATDQNGTEVEIRKVVQYYQGKCY